jgi:hypothetical protein
MRLVIKSLFCQRNNFDFGARQYEKLGLIIAGLLYVNHLQSHKYKFATLRGSNFQFSAPAWLALVTQKQVFTIFVQPDVSSSVFCLLPNIVNL